MEETPRTAPQGEAFSLDGMTADEMMELFESLAVVHITVRYPIMIDKV